MSVCDDLPCLVSLSYLGYWIFDIPFSRLPNARMLNIWLNIKKKYLQEENKKSGNTMQQNMHSYVCGKNLRSESFSFYQIYISRKKRCTRMRQERVYRAKSKYDLMKILSELVFIPQTQESIGCCITFPNFWFSS